MDKKDVKKIVRENYGKLAKEKGSCCSKKSRVDVVSEIGYSDGEIEDSGFKFKILEADKEISKSQYEGFNLESLKVELFK